MSHRVEKVASTIKHTLGEIFLYESDNPDFKFVSISHVEVSPDLKHARVVVSSVVHTERIVAELQAAAGFLRRTLARRMYLKFVPDLTFSLDEGYRLEQKIASLEKDEPHETPDS